MPRTAVWLDTAKTVWTFWGWESLDTYRRQAGPMGTVDANALWVPDWYDRIHAEKTVLQMAQAGVTMAITHFFKGFGLQHEAAEIERTRQLTQLCHQHGIKVLGYTQFGSLYLEAFLDEEPSAADWIQRDDSGSRRMRDYGVYFRKLPCHNRAPFVAYLKKCIAVGLSDVQLDGFHFDNTHAHACHCDECIRLFREYLQREFPNPRERFGLRHFQHVLPPPDSSLQGNIADPIVQEWIRFRIGTLGNCVSDLCAHARSIRPDVIMAFNAAMPRGTTNNNASRATYAYRYGPSADIVMAENGNFPRLEDGCLIHNIDAYAMGEAVGYHVLPTTWIRGEEGIGLPTDPRWIKRSIAEAAAFQAIAGANWALRPAGRNGGLAIDNEPLCNALAQYAQFIRSHVEIYARSTSRASVALLHSFPSLTFQRRQCYGAYAAMLQVLVQTHIPFDLVFTETIEKIQAYAVVLIPEVVCLSDHEVRVLKQYIDQGGCIVLQGDCGLKNEHARARAAGPWDDQTDNGRVVKFRTPLPEPRTDTYTSRVPLASTAAALAESIHGLMGAKERFVIHAPITVLASLRQTATVKACVHLINCAEQPVPAGIRIALHRDELAGRAATWHSPDNDLALVLQPTLVKDRWEFVLPVLDTYGVLTL